MSDEIIERLRNPMWVHSFKEFGTNARLDTDSAVADMTEAANEIAHLRRVNAELVAVLPDLLDHYLTCYDGNYDQLATDARAALRSATEKDEPT